MITGLRLFLFAIVLLAIPRMANSDLIVQYTFADGNSTNAANTGTLGSAMDGTITGGSIIASPLSADGKGLLLGGANGNGISMPNGYDFASQFTLSVLARLDAIQGASNVLFDDFGSPGVLLQVFSSNQKLVFTFNTVNDGQVDLESPDVFPLGSWQQVTAVYNGNQAHLLIDGLVVASASASGAVQNHPAVTPNIGVESGDLIAPWKGAIDDFSISDTATAVPEISAFFCVGLAGIGLFCMRLGMHFFNFRR